MKRKQQIVENPVGFRLFRMCARPVFYLLFHPKIFGRENVPRSGGVVLAVNHKGILECFLAADATKRNVHYLAAGYLFDLPIVGTLMKKFGAVRVDRAKDGDDPKNNSAYQYAVEYLQRGHLVYINPEGTRNKGETRQDLLLPLRHGAAAMVQKTGARLVPVAVVGDFNIIGRSVRMYVGKPIKTEGLSVEQTTEKLYDIMYKMLKDNGEKI
ncbi:MAG: 1-acyl-sn-glycerol-3-phosphate acyltransferase [Candidatus Nomurabacteria bacterium]|jgi:1-acyl-sn-glycerol-3-phosphate acyltransferase|nr:1-acyl-sn-glycerol-3-phosphate acyltransferase [Candidatus Nomurabacteria bacterium]